MNVRVNVFHFIENLCEQSLKADYPAYVKMIQRDLPLIVDAVAPDNAEGAANAETVRKVLQNLLQKGIVDGHTLKKLNDMVDQREAAHKAADESSDESVPGAEVDVDIDEDEKPTRTRRFSETLIQERMEADRERASVKPWYMIKSDEFSINVSVRTSGRYHKGRRTYRTQNSKNHGTKPAV